MKQLNNYIQEKLILNKDSKQNKNKRAKYQDVIDYLDNKLCLEFDVDSYLDDKYEDHWDPDQLDSFKEKISDINNENFFRTDLMEYHATLINSFKKIFGNNKGMIEWTLMPDDNSDNVYFMFVYDNRLDEDFKK